MSELVAPLVAGLVVGIAFVIMFALLINPPVRLTTPDNWVVGENVTQHYAFTSPMSLPKTAGAGGLNIASYGNNVYLTWYAPVPVNETERERGLIASSDVFFAGSSDGGTIFGPKISLTNRTMTNDPLIAADEESVYLLWTASGRYENIGSVYDDIFFRTSHDNGAILGPIINLSNNVGNSQYPQIVVSGNYVYVIWEDYTAGKGQILLRISNDRGNTFGNIINLGIYTQSSNAPQIAVSGNNVYVVWHDFEPEERVAFRASTDNGATFSKTKNLRTVHTGASCCPLIAASGNNVYVIWADNELDGLYSGHYDLHFRASHNRGVSFDNIISLSNIARDYKVAASGNYVYVTWTHVLPINPSVENAEAFFIRSTNKGITFENPINLSNNEGGSGNQQISVSGSNAYVTWVDHTLGYDEILFRGSSDNGASFGRVINLSNGTGISVDPHIVAADKTMYIVWKEFGDESHDDGIYIIRRVD